MKFHSCLPEIDADKNYHFPSVATLSGIMPKVCLNRIYNNGIQNSEQDTKKKTQTNPSPSPPKPSK